IPARDGAGAPRVFLSGGQLKDVILTPEGYEKLKAEIEHLSTVKRREVADRIRIAREFGDISENAEYDDAKNEQALLEHRIATLEERLRNARVIDKKDVAKDVVSIGSKVRLRDLDAKQTFEYRIVGSAEANPAENKLSNESPVGKAIIGRKKGDTVEVAAPRGALKFKILEIKAACAFEWVATSGACERRATSQKPCSFRCERSIMMPSSLQAATSCRPASVNPGPVSGEEGNRNGTPSAKAFGRLQTM